MYGNHIAYRIKSDSCVIRVMHLNLDKSWWNRGLDVWESDASAVASTIRVSTGLKRVFRTHGRNFVDFKIRKELFNQAAIAVRLEFGKESTSNLLEDKWEYVK